MAKKKEDKTLDSLKVKKTDSQELKELKGRLKRIVEGKESMLGRLQEVPENTNSIFNKSDDKEKVVTKEEYREIFKGHITNCNEIVARLNLKGSDGLGINHALMTYSANRKNDPKGYENFMNKVKKENNLSAKDFKELKQAYIDYVDNTMAVLDKLTPDEREEYLLSLFPSEVKDIGRAIMGKTKQLLDELIKEDEEDDLVEKVVKNNPIKTNNKVKSEDDEVPVGKLLGTITTKNVDANVDISKEFKDLTGEEYDPNKHKRITLTQGEKMNIYEAQLTSFTVNRDVFCPLSHNPIELAKHNIPLYKKLKEKSLDCLIGKDAIIMPLFHMPTKTLILPRDHEDDTMIGVLEFREELPVTNKKGGYTELCKSKPYMINSPYYGQEIERAIAYHYPLRLDGLIEPPMFLSEEAFNAIGHCIVNDREMPTDNTEVKFGNTDHHHIIDSMFTIAGTHLHVQCLKALKDLAVSKENLEAAIIERCSDESYLMPMIGMSRVTLNRSGNFEDFKFIMLGNVIRSMAGDLGILISLGIINPYESLTFVLDNEGRPSSTKFGFTPIDMDNEDEKRRDQAGTVLRLTDLGMEDRMGLTNYLSDTVGRMEEFLKANESTDRKELIKYFYNYLYTFNPAYVINDEARERIKIAIKTFEEAKLRGYKEFVIDQEGIDLLVKLLNDLLHNKDNFLNPSTTNPNDHLFICGTTLTVRAIGVGVGAIRHTFVDTESQPKSKTTKPKTSKTSKSTKSTKTKSKVSKSKEDKKDK